jgi:hypothetical protein
MKRRRLQCMCCDSGTKTEYKPLVTSLSLNAYAKPHELRLCCDVIERPG